MYKNYGVEEKKKKPSRFSKISKEPEFSLTKEKKRVFLGASF